MTQITPLREYRKQTAKMTLAEFAKIVGISPASLSRIEKGRQIPSPDLLKRLRDTTGLPPSAVHPDLAEIVRVEAGSI